MSDDKNQISFEEFSQMAEDAGIDSTPEEKEQDYRVGIAAADVMDELMAALESYPAFNSAHEGFGILKEEVDELWDEVKVKQGNRDIEKMRKEAVQVAAMAIRFIADVCHDEKANN